MKHNEWGNLSFKINNFVSMKGLNRFVTLFFIAGLFAPGITFGQEKLAGLSAKERIDIAEKEETEAKTDSEFQQMMQIGHDLFKQRHYLKAIREYEKAQEKRPYNVYPKVIIADIELSMKDTLAVLRQQEQRELQNQDMERNETLQSPKPENNPEPESEAERQKRANQWERDERRKLDSQREKEKEKEPEVSNTTGDIVILSMDDFQKELAEKYPTGITEEVIIDGNKTITKRVRVAGGKGDEYKRVEHGWGGVFFFKNGDAVTERVWKQETEK